jgi:hypothetical protein
MGCKSSVVREEKRIMDHFLLLGILFILNLLKIHLHSKKR